MMKSKSVLTVSVIAMMAVASARADIASTTYVNNQVQSVSTALSTHTGNGDIHVTAADKAAWSGKQDTGNIVTTEEAWITANNANQGTTKYPSLSAVDERITSKLDDSVGGYISKGSATVPIYFNASGEPTPITSYSGKAATAGVADSANAVIWANVSNKADATTSTKGIMQVGTDLSVTNGVVSVDKATTVASGNTKPVTSDAVYTAINDETTGAVATANAYTDSQVGSVAGDVSSLSSTVSGHTSSISQLETNVSTLNSGKQDKITSTAKLNSDLVDDTNQTHKFVTAEEKTAWSGKQAALDTNQMAAVNSGITSALVGKISTNETAINTLNGDSTVANSVANKISSALTAYSTTAQMNSALADKADKATIGTVPSGKTVVGMIQDSQYDDTALAGRVQTIENSAAYNSGIDSTKVTQIATNASNITTLMGADTVAGSVKKAEKDAKAYADSLASNYDAAGAAATAKTEAIAAAESYTDTEVAKKVTANTAITGATKTKITYDSKGLVTAGADLAASDIPTLEIAKINGLQTALDGKQASGNYITVPAATGTNGKSVLTYDAETTTYYWEEIGR